MNREARLDELRREAQQTGAVQATGARPAGAPFPAADHRGSLATDHRGSLFPVADAEHGYYGLPLLKRPTWTWEVPSYFFVGGTAGAAALIGAVAGASGHPTLARDARWIAAAGAALSPPLLISDLGRPDRLLNMLRVFKVQSPMSVGVWTLVAFSTASATAAFADVAVRLLPPTTPVRIVRNASELMAASTGLAMSTYTGVLIGATSIPVWSANVHLLPIHFAASSLGSAASLLELAGHRHRALYWLALAAAAVETAVGVNLELRGDPANGPLREGRSGALIRTGGILSGPVPLVLRLLGGRSSGWRRAAGLCAVAGSILTRFGWVRAGSASADDPDTAL